MKVHRKSTWAEKFVVGFFVFMVVGVYIPALLTPQASAASLTEQERVATTKLQIELKTCVAAHLGGIAVCQGEIQEWTNNWFTTHTNLSVKDQQFSVSYSPGVHGDAVTTFVIAIFFWEPISSNEEE